MKKASSAEGWEALVSRARGGQRVSRVPPQRRQTTTNRNRRGATGQGVSASKRNDHNKRPVPLSIPGGTATPPVPALSLTGKQLLSITGTTVIMHIRSLTAAFAFAALCWVSVLGQQAGVTKIMPIGDIKPGMIGVGRTVFQGTELKDFKVHIIGVLRNVQGPRRDLILARLEGGPLAETGVAAGMSGSPVYIDGKLIGAVGYSIGSFPKEAIAGITPIEEMKDAYQGV